MESIEAIKTNYPNLPDDYLSWLVANGGSETNTGVMIYSSPIPCSEIIDGLDNEEEVILIADDMAGYSIGYMKSFGNWNLVGIDSCTLEIDFIEGVFCEYIES